MAIHVRWVELYEVCLRSGPNLCRFLHERKSPLEIGSGHDGIVKSLMMFGNHVCRRTARVSHTHELIAEPLFV